MTHLSRSAIAFAALATSAAAQTTERVSVSSAGVQGNQFSEWPSISHDGRWVAFQSIASTLVASDTNNTDDVFVHDRQTGATVRASVSLAGVEADGFSGKPRIAGLGRYVAFESGATNLVAGDTNGAMDVLVHDLSTGATERVSLSSAGAPSNGPSYAPSISADGRFVAFYSGASNLVNADTNSAWDVFVRDRQLATTVRASVRSDGAQVSGTSSAPSISGDGRFVAFHSVSSGLVLGDTNGAWDVFVRDLLDGTTVRASVTSSGAQALGSSADATLSGDGRFVAFQSAAVNLVVGDTNGREDVFVHDRTTGATVRASVGANGQQASDASRYATISADGSTVAFQSLADDLAGPDLNVTWDVYVRDLVLGRTTMASFSDFGVPGDLASERPAISSDGALVAFHSYSALVSNDTNNTADVFVRDLGPLAPTVYCTSSTSTNGCSASIGSAGVPSASASSGFTLSVTQMDGQRSGLIFYGTSGAQSVPWAAGSTSFLCVKLPTQRLAPQSTGGHAAMCDGTLTQDFLAFADANPSALGQPFAAGDTLRVQGWFRDPAAPKTTNLSNALAFSLLP